MFVYKLRLKVINQIISGVLTCINLFSGMKSYVALNKFCFLALVFRYVELRSCSVV